MKITLINPAIGNFADEACMEPLPLGALAGLTPLNVEVILYDDRLEPIPYDEPTDLAAINVQIFTARRAYQISAEYRQRGVPVILGGIHPTLIPEEAALYADSIFLGDAETLWSQVLEDVWKKQLKPIYNAGTGPPQPDSLTRRDLYKRKKYLPISLIQFSRGCKYECEFCATSAYFHKKHFHRCVEQVLKEIESQDRKQIFFVDDNILSDFQAAKVLFRELIPLKLHWVSQASIDMTQDRELMALMIRSGCLGHVIGFESINTSSLQAMKKTQNLLGNIDTYKPQLEILRDYGLQTWAAFTLGHDHDTLDSIKATLDFALENKFTFAAFNVLLPYPGTKLYQRLLEEKRLLFEGKWWLHPNYRFNHAAFQPMHMTADELTQAAYQARRTFNSIDSIFHRVWDFKTNMRNPYRLGVYLVYNPLFRQETFKKQGISLGTVDG
ncbi:MAG: radical SAM protein [Anaerolineales bacterium]|nr:radical SAM protein [Anaerolineales bacterium]